jgi:AraC-like DNA-binding protein
LIGLVDTDRFRRFDPHRHIECEINFVARGNAAVLCPDGRWDLSAGDLLLLPSLHPHTLMKASRDVILWVLAIRPEEAPGFPRRSPARLEIGRAERESCARLAAELAAIGDEATLDAGIRYLYRRLRLAGRQIDAPEGKTLHPALFRAVEILRHSAEPLTAAALAREAGISPSHLLRVVKEETGLTLTGLRQAIRLREFLRIQRESPRDGLLANALRAGFGSYNQFARIFRSQFGIGPREHFARERGRRAQ